MINVMKRIWNEIKHGENIDFYITIITALVLSILNVLGISTSAYLPTITLAILALLAISILGNRQRLEKIIQGKTADEVFLKEFPEDIYKQIIKAEEVFFIGVNLRRTLFHLTTEIDKKLEAGHKIRVLLVNPEGIGNTGANSRIYVKKGSVGMSDENHSKVIKMVLDHMASKKNSNPNADLEIKTIDYPIHFGAIVTNINATRAKIFIENYGFRMEQDDIPKVILTYDDGLWFEHYKMQIEALWDSALYWDPSLKEKKKS